MRKTGYFVAALAALACVSACSNENSAGGLEVRHAWSRPATEGMPVGVAYFEIVNRGRFADTLTGASSPVAEHVEFHHTIHEEDMARMRPAGELVIAPGASLKAEPNGLHMMLMGLKQPLVAGTQVPLTLHFRSAGDITVQLEIRPHE